MACGDLGRTYIVFSGCHNQDLVKDMTAQIVDDGNYKADNDADSGHDGEDGLQSTANELLDYFPILQDLVKDIQNTCQCFPCSGGRVNLGLPKDENCLAFKAFMEVMFYFSHGIADAFGAPDASGSSEKAAISDLGALDILKQAIRWNLFDSSLLEGTLTWHSLLSTAARVFLGCPALENMTDACRDEGGAEVHTSFASRVKPTVVAIQYGALSVAAPWLDISQPLKLRHCLRFEIVPGARLAICTGDMENNRTLLHNVTGDISVVETQQTEDVSDFNERFPPQQHKQNTRLQLNEDASQETYSWVLVSVDQYRHKLLMRVLSGLHSRMVEPSRTIVQLSRAISIPTCGHDVSS
ncbi:hypothetical protein QQS21_003543 [Conoideocrella luteorostrata]|uniref:Uncharacterized protein n=1 Tax=Conoideocrella luteorostrata TaxID=1105319 RepID=A0AAJ0CVV9_9HYPO|nr:hypothetical protein QQS21_003543 [Conoideocrella luteorostrata]